jgi:hypothetical protein
LLAPAFAPGVPHNQRVSNVPYCKGLKVEAAVVHIDIASGEGKLVGFDSDVERKMFNAAELNQDCTVRQCTR